jgi:uncharacterized metal-binding protein
MAESTMTKVGIISCSGEAIPGGSIARLATRRVLEGLRPQSTVTLCLPLFLAGEESERKFARTHPTITVDGCEKLCAKRGTETYSGSVAASLVVPDLVGAERLARCHRSQRKLDQNDEEAVWIVAERLAATVDELLADKASTLDSSQTPGERTSAGACACGGRSTEGMLVVGGRTVIVNGLSLIFGRLAEKGLESGETAGDSLLQTVRIYHEVPPDQADAYRAALVEAYQAFCSRGQGAASARAAHATA